MKKNENNYGIATYRRDQWKYHYTHLTPEQKRLVEYVMDTGIGERNAYGMGFECGERSLT